MVMGRRVLKPGMSLWRVTAYDRVDLDEWVIRSIKRPNKRRGWLFREKENTLPVHVYLAQKNEFTWVRERRGGKRSKKEYGWAKNICSVWVMSFLLEDYLAKGLPDGFSFSKMGAFTLALRREKKYLATEIRSGGDQEGIDEYKKSISQIKRRMTMLKSKHQAHEVESMRSEEDSQEEGGSSGE